MNNNQQITWEDFQKVEMRVGTVIHAELFKEAKKPALKLKIDFGELGVKRSSAQITELHTPEEIVGKQIVAVVNFPPKQIANMMSECLVLGAVDSHLGISVLSPNHKVTKGTRIS
jgi:tRNA-binding protein